MTPFHVGMRVVCVDDQWHSGGYGVPDYAFPLNNGEVYTVLSVQVLVGLYRDGNAERECLTFCEVAHPDPDSAFAAERFRPAHENRMDELRTLLAPVPSKELVQS